MITIAIVSQKGGAGKTTLATNIAVAAQLDGGESLIIDLDPQGSAAGWADGREAEWPVVAAEQTHRLKRTLETAREHAATLAVLDTAPHSEGTALEAARVADLVLIPCRPAIFDLRAVQQSFDLAALAGTPAVAVLNGVPAKGGLADEAQAAIEAADREVAPCRIGQRIAFVHAATGGLTPMEADAQSKASKEAWALARWAIERAETTMNSKEGA